MIAGTDSNSTREAIELTLHAKQAGADGALLLSPYYNKPTQEGIYAHYAAIAEATRFPLVIYNIPGRTASNIAPEIIARLARLEHIVGVKESSGSLDQMTHVIAKCPSGFCRALWRRRAHASAALDRGQGRRLGRSRTWHPARSATSCAASRAVTSRAPRRSITRCFPFDVLFCETNPIPVKAAASELGWCGPEMRLPADTHHRRESRAPEDRAQGPGHPAMTSAFSSGSSSGMATGVMVVGAQGRMGLEVRAALAAEPRLRFAGALERPGQPEIGQMLAPGVVLQDDPKRALSGCGVAIDFSVPICDACEPASRGRRRCRLRDRDDGLRRGGPARNRARSPSGSPYSTPPTSRSP